MGGPLLNKALVVVATVLPILLSTTNGISFEPVWITGEETLTRGVLRCPSPYYASECHCKNGSTCAGSYLDPTNVRECRVRHREGTEEATVPLVKCNPERVDILVYHVGNKARVTCHDNDKMESCSLMNRAIQTVEAVQVVDVEAESEQSFCQAKARLRSVRPRNVMFRNESEGSVDLQSLMVTATCMKQISLSGSAGITANVNCARPPVIEGSVYVHSLKRGGIAEYSCPAGEKLYPPGQSNRTCQLVNGRLVWSGQNITCKVGAQQQMRQRELIEEGLRQKVLGLALACGLVGVGWGVTAFLLWKTRRQAKSSAKNPGSLSMVYTTGTKMAGLDESLSRKSTSTNKLNTSGSVRSEAPLVRNSPVSDYVECLAGDCWETPFVPPRPRLPDPPPFQTVDPQEYASYFRPHDRASFQDHQLRQSQAMVVRPGLPPFSTLPATHSGPGYMTPSTVPTPTPDSASAFVYESASPYEPEAKPVATTAAPTAFDTESHPSSLSGSQSPHAGEGIRRSVSQVDHTHQPESQSPSVDDDNLSRAGLCPPERVQRSLSQRRPDDEHIYETPSQFLQSEQ